MGVLERIDSRIISKCKNRDYILLYKFIKWSTISFLCWKLLKLGLIDLVNWAEPRSGYVYLLIVEKTPNFIYFFDGLFALLLLIVMFMLFTLLAFGIIIKPGKEQEPESPLKKTEIPIPKKPTQAQNKDFTSKFTGYILVGIFLLCVVLWAGAMVLEEEKDSIKVDLIDSQYRYNEVEITFQTYNEGFFSARNVKVKISVIEDTGEWGKNYNKFATGDILGSIF
ncbi:hypothetical protein FTO70_03705 [Methanosarcina sp. KYL-1]|uniref:hypothetical protein n=1 Tax=Methanosarcina sp. KYL-1 TaxID=2602068 RepID=UPI0021016E06|nr:hypothetical protein [Methanosarcina sp. KYL-1]MCQ1534809.1 hypothetical protein [Methanosarcina sp. KYL-1]